MPAQKFYNVIIKVDTTKFIKYHKVPPNKFLRLYAYLDKTFPQWRWGNVFFKRGQIGSFTNTNRPSSF